MTHGSLFSGEGGFDLAAEWMGWGNKFHLEIDDFCNTILNYYWPNATGYKDIRTTDFTIWRGLIDVLSGGFPCQPYSVAGKRLGKEDDRHLWPEMLRAIREIQPRWVVGENVRGLISWNGGLVFDEVQSDLETSGYEVLPFLLPACGVNAPHRRDRIFFVAHANGYGHKWGRSKQDRSTPGKSISQQEEWKWLRSNNRRIGEQGTITDTSSAGREELDIPGFAAKPGHGSRCGNAKPTDWRDFPTQSPICCGNDEFSARLDGITFSNWRNESIKAHGNAVVPQLVYQIFKTIELCE